MHFVIHHSQHVTVHVCGCRMPAARYKALVSCRTILLRQCSITNPNLQVAPRTALHPSLWQLLCRGYIIPSNHATAMYIQLPSLTGKLQGLGLKLTASSTTATQKSALKSTDASDVRTDRVSKKVGGNDISKPGSQQHQGICFQPVLVAHGADGSSGGQVVREVVRRNPAALPLWATEALNKRIGIISDPSCGLILRCRLSESPQFRQNGHMSSDCLRALSCVSADCRRQTAYVLLTIFISGGIASLR